MDYYKEIELTERFVNPEFSNFLFGNEEKFLKFIKGKNFHYGNIMKYIDKLKKYFYEHDYQFHLGPPPSLFIFDLLNEVRDYLFYVYGYNRSNKYTNSEIILDFYIKDDDIKLVFLFDFKYENSILDNDFIRIIKNFNIDKYFYNTNISNIKDPKINDLILFGIKNSKLNYDGEKSLQYRRSYDSLFRFELSKVLEIYNEKNKIQKEQKTFSSELVIRYEPHFSSLITYYFTFYDYEIKSYDYEEFKHLVKEFFNNLISDYNIGLNQEATLEHLLSDIDNINEKFIKEKNKIEFDLIC